MRIAPILAVLAALVQTPPAAVEPIVRVWLAAPDASVVAVRDSDRLEVWAEGTWPGPADRTVRVRAWFAGGAMLSPVTEAALHAHLPWADLALVIPELWCGRPCPAWQRVRLAGARGGELELELELHGRHRVVVLVPVRLVDPGAVVAGPARCGNPGCFMPGARVREIWRVPRGLAPWLRPDSLEVVAHGAVVLRRGVVPEPPGGWR